MANIVLTAVGAFILLVVLAIFLSGIKILKEWERAPVLTLGRYRGLKGPGVIYVVPFISRVPFVISTRLQAMAFKTEQTLTKDNVPVVVDAVMYFQPVDFEKVVLGAENYALATQFAAQTTIREVIGQVTFDEILSERERIGARIREIIDSKTEAWGIKVVSTEIRDVIIPPALQDAMSRQAQAERERRARVTLAIAEYEAAQKMTEAAKYYETNNIAFQLRWMNIVYELGLQGKNTIMLIPTNMPPVGVSGSVPPYGYFGVKELTERAKGSESQQTSS